MIISNLNFCYSNLLKKKEQIITDTDIKQYKNIKKIQKKRKLKFILLDQLVIHSSIQNHKIFKNFQILEIKLNKKIYKLKINLYGSIQIKNLLMAILASKYVV